jgi:tRNA nucleotidyltransferase (CCA-adding enzyme)
VTLDEEIARLHGLIPDPVREVCRRLTESGFQAVTVGGAVRDAILDRPIGDWDVATAAHPEEVKSLFRRTIDTGLQHGTVTVMIGRGSEREAVEVTTFRGEGAYSDARRPDTVTFGVPLYEDLARRDLVINAMAYDPIHEKLHDPFGGHADLTARVIRAVGVARERFSEDGLRVMRAVRFAATLEFELDAETEAAIPEALPSLARVSQERVRVELLKLLAARDPGPALAIAERTGIINVILPELHPDTPDGHQRWERAVTLVRALSQALPRLGALVACGLEEEGRGRAKVADHMMRRLTLSNVDRERVIRLVRYYDEWRRDSWTDRQLRELLGKVGRDNAGELIDVWRAGGHGDEAESIFARANGILERGEPLVVGDLAVGGADVLEILDAEPGPIVGVVLRALLARVLEDPALNTRETLAGLIPQVAAEHE